MLTYPDEERRAHWDILGCMVGHSEADEDLMIRTNKVGLFYLPNDPVVARISHAESYITGQLVDAIPYYLATSDSMNQLLRDIDCAHLVQPVAWTKEELTHYKKEKKELNGWHRFVNPTSEQVQATGQKFLDLHKQKAPMYSPKGQQIQ